MSGSDFSIISRRQSYGYLAALAVLLILPLVAESQYTLHILIMMLIYITAASSLRTLAISGQVSMAHAGFMSIGAYTSACLARYLGFSPWLSIPLGGLATMLVAVLIGFPFSRVRAIYFSMVSLFFGIGILSVNSIFGKYTGHINGLIGIPPLFVGSKIYYYYFFLGLTVVCLFILWRFEACRIGICLKAIDQSPDVAASVGISEVKFRVLSLGVSCFVVGILGACYAHYSMVISYSSFDLLASINLLVFVLIGGLGSFAGPIIGAVVLFIIPEVFRGLMEYTPYLYAGMLLLVIFAMPRGLVGLPGQLKSLFVQEK